MKQGLFTGKAAEAYVWTRFLEHGFVPYVPLLDVEGVDLIIRTREGEFFNLQVKSRGEPDPYGLQIKKLWREEGKLAFDYLVIVVPLEDERGYESWIVPAREVKHRVSNAGYITLKQDLLRQDWQQFHENWRLTTEA